METPSNAPTPVSLTQAPQAQELNCSVGCPCRGLIGGEGAGQDAPGGPAQAISSLCYPGLSFPSGTSLSHNVTGLLWSHSMRPSLLLPR